MYVSSHRFQDYNVPILFLENVSHGEFIRGLMTASLKVISRISTLALTVSAMLRYEMFDLENLVQTHGVQHSQWSYSMANTKVNKSHN